jgi:hypothetical protein
MQGIGSTVHTFVGGKIVHLQFRPFRNGPTPGNYVLLPAIQDLIYGRIVLMVPRGAVTGSLAAKAYLSGNPGSVSQKDGFPGISRGGSFVLSERPIPGMNTLVVTSGFADLIGALGSSGTTISLH